MLSQLSYASIRVRIRDLGEFASQPLVFVFRFSLPTDDIISQTFSFVNTFLKVFSIFLKVFLIKNKAVRLDCLVDYRGLFKYLYLFLLVGFVAVHKLEYDFNITAHTDQ